MTRRAQADQELAKQINSALYEYRGIVTRIKRGGFPSNADIEVIEDVERLLEDASGRLTLRVAEDAE